MGGFGTGFLQGFTNAAQQKIDQRHNENQQKQDELRNELWKIAYDPNKPETLRKNAQDQLQKLYGPEGKKGLQKFGEIFSRIAGHGQQQQDPSGGAQPQAQQQPSPRGALQGPAPVSVATPPTFPGGSQNPTPQAQPQASGGTLEISGKGTPPFVDPRNVQSQPSPHGRLAAPQFQLPPAPTDAELGDMERAKAKRQLEATDQVYQFWEDKAKKVLGPDANPRDIALYAGSQGTHLPPQEKRIADKGVARPGEDPATGKPYEGLWDHIVEPDGTETWAKRPASKSGGQIRNLTHSVSRSDALSEMKNGVEFKDQEGNPIDVEKLPPNMGLQGMVSGDKMFWVPITPNQKTVTVGNVVYGVTPYEIKDIGQGGGTALGVARTGSQNTPTNIVMDAQGVPHVLGSTTAPNTPGAGQRIPQSPQSAPRTPQSPTATPTGNAPSAQPSQSPQSSVAPSGGRQVAGVTPGMFKDFVTTARSIQQALTQVVGDDSNPDLKTLVSNAPKILDDKAATQRVGKAISMMLGEGEGGLEGAHVSSGVSVGPVSFGLGGFGEYLKQVLGMPAKTADQINQNLKDAMKGMSQDERDLVASSVAAFEESIAMRAINKSGVSNSQVSAIQRTLPLVGVNTFNKSDFATRVQNWAQQGINGSWGVPPQYFRPEFINRLKSVSSQMEQLKNGTGPSPKGKLNGPQKTVKMKSPDGKVTKDVPQDQVEHFKSIGATVVQ